MRTIEETHELSLFAGRKQKKITRDRWRENPTGGAIFARMVFHHLRPFVVIALLAPITYSQAQKKDMYFPNCPNLAVTVL